MDHQHCRECMRGFMRALAPGGIGRKHVRRRRCLSTCAFILCLRRRFSSVIRRNDIIVVVETKTMHTFFCYYCWHLLSETCYHKSNTVARAFCAPPSFNRALDSDRCSS